MAKIRIIIVLLGICWATTLSAQDFKYGYLVKFTDKSETKYDINYPLDFLSQRAIDRRNKYNIEITEEDFPVNNTYIDSILKFNSTLHVTSRWFNSAVFYTHSDSFVNQLNTCSFVKEVSLVYQNKSFKSVSEKNKWNVVSEGDEYGSSYNQISMCNAQKLHEKGFKGQGIQIAVLDGGFWRANEFSAFDSLFQNNRILSHWDFVSHNNNVFDDNSHGMSVLSTMAGNLPGELIGTAPEALYHLFRTENVDNEFPIEEENFIAGAEAADSAGADIITASLGYSLFDDPTMNYTYADMDGKSTRCTQGAEMAFSKGIFVVNGAGNAGSNPWHYITAPSDGENVLCVGAVNGDGSITSFSGRGPSSDGRVKPDVMAQGGNTTVIKSDGKVGTSNGTSFSGPVMAGMVACLWQALPEYSNKQLLDLVRSYGNKFANPDSTYGFGIPDFGKSTFLIDSFIYSNTSSNELVKVYPNPFTESLRIHLYIQKGQEIKIELNDGSGRNIHTEKRQMSPASYNLIEIDGLSGIGVGFYFLTIYTQEGNLVSKIVKQ